MSRTHLALTRHAAILSSPPPTVYLYSSLCTGSGSEARLLCTSDEQNLSPIMLTFPSLLENCTRDALSSNTSRLFQTSEQSVFELESFRLNSLVDEYLESSVQHPLVDCRTLNLSPQGITSRDSAHHQESLTQVSFISSDSNPLAVDDVLVNLEIKPNTIYY